MSDWKLRIYHKSPLPMRTLIASTRGYYLRTWRYGRETDRLIEEYLDREGWSAEQWKRWREEKLVYLLHRAATQVPYYREHWEARRKQGDRASWDYLENWGILSKEEVRTAPFQFIADDCKVHNMYHEHTSGTTGKPLDLWWSRSTVRKWYAIFEARCRRWHDVSRNDRWAILGGQLIAPINQTLPPFWVWNMGLNQLYMSSYHLAFDLIPSYLEALKKYKISHLLGYTSSLYLLAVEILRLKRSDIHMNVVVTNAEPLYEYQKEAISSAFNCPVRETYGMAEIAGAASECPQGQMHIWPEVGVIEVMTENNSAPAGVAGDMICTGLLNMDMPLIRYRVGDRGSLLPDFKSCSCGRLLPLLNNVDGRTDDILYTLDGRQIGRLDPVFKAHLPVIEAQIIQETINKLVVRFVPAAGYTLKDGESIIERLRERLGNVDVILESVSQIPREANGKFRAVVSKIKRNKIE